MRAAPWCLSCPNVRTEWIFFTKNAFKLFFLFQKKNGKKTTSPASLDFWGFRTPARPPAVSEKKVHGAPAEGLGELASQILAQL
jgi:hypothetical protein